MRVVAYSDEGLSDVLAVLRNGGVVAHATETCYGLACDLSNIDAVKKLFAIKQRPESQPVSALFASVDDAKKYVEWNERADELATEYLPGPLTIILPMKKNVLRLFPVATGEWHTVGVRISSGPIARSLVEAFGLPLSTTSANIHGQPNPYSAEDMIKQFADQAVQPDLIIDSGLLPQNPPSTIVDLTKSEQTHRKGSITI